MKVLKNLTQVAKETKAIEWEVEKAYVRNMGCNYFFANEIEVKIVKDKFIILEGSDEDYKKFFMEYEINDYEYKVYVDDYDKWEKCRVIRVDVDGEHLRRMTVITEKGTQLNRVCKYICDEEDERCVADRCVYFWDKEIE